MLYYLFRFLEQWGISGSHMWGYISFRALLALILSLVISAWFGEKFIKFLKSKQITETQRDASIDPFGVKKIGVPSMGGVIIILAILVPVLLLPSCGSAGIAKVAILAEIAKLAGLA